MALSLARRMAVLSAAAVLPQATGVLHTLQVAGIQGVAKMMNGLYTADKDIAHDGYPCYKKDLRVGPEDVALCIDNHGFWVIQPVSQIGEGSGYIKSSQRNSPLPMYAGPWEEYDDEAWSANPKISVALLPSPEHTLVRRAVAVMLLGSLLCLAVIMSFTHSFDKHVRSQAWMLINASVTFCIANLFVISLYTLLQPWTMDMLSEARKNAFSIIFTGIIFSIAYAALNFCAWKLQYSDHRLAIVNGLGAHLVAMFGRVCFRAFFDEAYLWISPEFDSLFRGNRRNSDFMSGFLVVIAAWAILALYRWAALGARMDRFKDPPKHAWTVVPTPIGDQADRSCFRSAFNTENKHAAHVQGMDWKEVAADAEDEAASVILGLLIITVIKRWAFKTYGEDYSVGLLQDVTTLESWAIAFAGLLAANLIIFLVRSRVVTGERFGSLLQRTAWMSVAWWMAELIQYIVFVKLTESRAMLHVSVAVAVTMACFLFIFVVDFILDNTVGKRSGHTMAKICGLLSDSSSSMTPAEKAMYVVTSGMGLVIGMSWSFAFDDAWATLSQAVTSSETLTTNENLVIKALGCFLIAALLTRAYLVGILPKARLSENEHERAIRLEADQLLT